MNNNIALATNIKVIRLHNVYHNMLYEMYLIIQMLNKESEHFWSGNTESM